MPDRRLPSWSAGAARLRGRARSWSDYLVASDPGLSRLIQALEVALAIGVSIAVLYGFAELVHPLWTPAPAGVHLSSAQAAQLAAQHHGVTLLAMLFGGLVAMMSTLAVMDVTVRDQALTMAGMPVPLLATLALSIELSRWHTIGLVGLALVMGAGVYMRKFVATLGPRAFFYGLLLFMGYFFGFLAGRELPLGQIYWVAAILWVAVAVNFGLRLAVYNPLSRGTVARSQTSFLARGRGVLAAAADVLITSAGPERRRGARRLRRRLLRLNESALTIDAQLGDPRAGLSTEQAAARHRELFELELTLVNIGRVVQHLVDADASGALRGRAAVWLQDLRTRGRSADAVAWGREAEAEAQSRPVGAPVDAAGLAYALSGLCSTGSETIEAWSRPTADPEATAGSSAAAPASDGAGNDAAADSEARYESPVTLMGGNLAGSSQVSRAAVERPDGLLARLHLDAPAQTAIRVAIAVGVACAAGSALSERRFYWAVIAVFITFMGANTAGEQIAKALHRVVGTSVGIVLGSLLAQAVGHTVWSLAIIIPSIAIGVYFLRVSYSLMVIGITIMVAQLYVQLGEYSSGLLVLRLEETVLGAAIAMAAALVLFPVSTRKSTRAAARAYLDALADLLGRLPGELAQPAAQRRLTTQARALDSALQQLRATARPLTRDPFLREDVEHNLTLIVNTADHARNLVAALQASEPFEDRVHRQLCELVDREHALIDRLGQEIGAGHGSAGAGEDPEQAPAEPLGERLVDLGRRLAADGIGRTDARRQVLRSLQWLDTAVWLLADNLGSASGPADGDSASASRSQAVGVS